MAKGGRRMLIRKFVKQNRRLRVVRLPGADRPAPSWRSAWAKFLGGLFRRP
jgi:hypothetical protein